MSRREQVALGDLRVLDITSHMGTYCTKLLADLGADVIRIEPPGGDSTRKIGPFAGDAPHPERSLHFFAFNANKRSITLNLDSVDGQELFKALVRTSDVVVETFPVGYMHEKGLGFAQLSAINPGIIVASITGFGQTGAHSGFKSCDLVGVAMGGLMYLSGLPEDPPSRPGACQGYYLASCAGAVGILTALNFRDRTGKGQHVDISMQAAVIKASERAAATYALTKVVRKRIGVELYRGIKDYFPCKDGWVVCSPLGASGADAMLQWMAEEGMAADLRDDNYAQLISLIKVAKAGTMQIEGRRLESFSDEMAHIENVWRAWLMTHSREELQEGCQNRKVRLMPVNDAADLLSDVQLLSRDFFVDVEHPEIRGTFKYPGVPYRLSETPCTLKRRAPLCGEHNLEVFQKELGIPQQQLVSLAELGVI